MGEVEEGELCFMLGEPLCEEKACQGCMTLGAIKCDPSNPRVMEEPPSSSPKMWELIITMQKETTWKLLSTILLLAEITKRKFLRRSGDSHLKLRRTPKSPGPCQCPQDSNHHSPMVCLSRESTDLGN